MTRPIDSEVLAEIAMLKAIAPLVRPLSAFGDDNRAAIAADIDVLTDRLSLDQVHDRYGVFDQYVLDSAISTCDWLHGRLADDELSPARNWGELVQ